MNKEHKNTFKEIIKTVLISFGVILLSEALNLFKTDLVGSLLSGLFGYGCIFVAINRI